MLQPLSHTYLTSLRPPHQQQLFHCTLVASMFKLIHVFFCPDMRVFVCVCVCVCVCLSVSKIISFFTQSHLKPFTTSAKHCFLPGVLEEKKSPKSYCYLLFMTSNTSTEIEVTSFSSVSCDVRTITAQCRYRGMGLPPGKSALAQSQLEFDSHH